MKNVIAFVFAFLLLVSSCTETLDTSQSKPERTTHEVPELNTDTNYILFTLNVHDWVFPEQSADTILKTIEIHEKYNIPVDIYLNEQVFQILVDEYPEVITKLKSSSVVSVSYHVRPPMPIYSGLDLFSYSTKSAEELYSLLLPYEEHKLNISTALPDDQEGGYAYVKKIIGYAPRAVSLIFDTAAEQEAMAKIYKEKGAQLAVIHGKESILGQQKYGLFVRPESVEIKWYEPLKQYQNGKITAESWIQQNIAEVDTKSSLFVNLKMHDNNYYTSGTTFDPVYWKDGVRDGTLNDMPFDISEGVENAVHKSAEDTAAMWEWYENAVAYAAEHPKLYTAINNDDIIEMLQ